MADKSALEKIDDLYVMMHELNSKMDLLRHSVQILHNGLLLEDSRPVTSKLSANPPIQVKVVENAPKTVPASTSARVFGKYIGSNGVVISAADIKIADSVNKVVKRLHTKPDGTWETWLPIGKYTIKYTKQGLAPSYRMVSVNEGQAEVEAV